MKFRAELSVTPAGMEEKDSIDVFRVDIDPVRQIENRGFGHVISEYRATLYKYNNETMQRVLNSPPLEIEVQANIVHDRRDGTLDLLKRALEALTGPDAE